jgi:hypothetical protein
VLELGHCRNIVNPEEAPQIYLQRAQRSRISSVLGHAGIVLSVGTIAGLLRGLAIFDAANAV